VDNLLAASKNIGTTHITNGAYRLHPIEWAIGEAAGTVADFALDHHRTPRQIEASNALTGQLQADLLGRGVPIYWFNDLTRSNPAFAAAQFLAAREIFVPNPKEFHFDPNGPVTRAQAVRALGNALFSNSGTSPTGQGTLQPARPQEIVDAERRLVQDGYMQASSAAAMNQNLHWQALEPASQKLRLRSWQPSKRSAPVTRADFVMWLENVYWRRRAHHATASLVAPRATRP
jgi:hypothetical protein